MNEILEDTISRNKEFFEQRQLRVQRLKELNAPNIIVETEEMISRMTLAEYKVYCKKLAEDYKTLKLEYVKTSPIQKCIVDEIYDRGSKLEYNYSLYSSDFLLMKALDPLSFMSQDDYNNDLYESFLDHAKELYRERFKDDYSLDVI